jgi:hypothetical protein
MERPIDHTFKAGVIVLQGLYPASDVVASVGDIEYLVKTSKSGVVME